MSNAIFPSYEKRAASSLSDEPIKLFSYNPPNAVEVDGNGVILPIAHQNGLTIIIPVWGFPSPDGQMNELYVYLDDVEVFHESYPSPLTQLEYRPVIDPKFFAIDGVLLLSYKTITSGNPAYSGDQPLTVRRTPVVELPEPKFLGATLWGYWNCQTVPKLWEEVCVAIPVPGLIQWQVNDELRLGWAGFDSLNGSGKLLVLAEFVRLLTPEDVKSGYTFSITDYKNHVEPMERNASALAVYSIYRNGVRIALSNPGLVRIDRARPGQSISCGPNQ